MIELINVHKSFDNNKVLNGISIKIQKGETFVIIGQSGTGKTVAIRHIAGLIQPDSGDVLIDGVKMNGASSKTKEELRKKMGIVFQSGALINWMSVKDNIALPLIENKLYPMNEIEKIVDIKLEILQLNSSKNKMPADISGGMCKRVSLARVLVRNPGIILYDEPTSGLDPVMSSLINDLIRQMQKKFNVTSVVVTHDMNSAYYIADKIAMLYEGKIIQCDKPEAIKNSKNAVVKQFIEGKTTGPIEVISF